MLNKSCVYSALLCQYRTALGPHPPPTQRVPCLSRRIKRPGCGFEYPLPSSPEDKGKIEL